MKRCNPLRDRLADWYFDHGWGSYGDCYTIVNDEIKARFKRMRAYRRQKK